MPELGPYGSVRGARGNSRPYRESEFPPPTLAPIQDLLHDGPRMHLGFQSHRGMGGAGRWKEREDMLVFGQRRQRVTTKRSLRLSSIEEYMSDVRIFGE